MKDMVLVPIKFFIFLMVVLSAGTLIQVLVDFARLSSGLQSEWYSTVSLLVVNGFFVWIIPATGLTWLFSSFAILKTGKSKRIRMVFLTVLVTGTMFSLLFFMPSLDHVRSAVSALDFQVPERTIVSGGDAFFTYDGAAAEGKGVALVHENTADARFRAVIGVRKDLERNRVVFGVEGFAVPIDSLVGGRQGLYEAGGVFSQIGALMLRGLQAYQADCRGNLMLSGIMAAAFGLLLASFWFFVRLTQWPLANCLLTLAMLIGVFLLPLAIGQPFASSLVAALPIPFRPYVLPAVYSVVSVVCFGGILLLPPLKDRQPGGLE